MRSRGISAAGIRAHGYAGRRREEGDESSEEIDENEDNEETNESENEAGEQQEQLEVQGSSSNNVRDSNSTASPSKKKSKKRKHSSDEESNDEKYTAGQYGRAAFSHKNRQEITEKTGHIDFCAICKLRFTVTPYTQPSPDGKGLLCRRCASMAEKTPVKRSAARAKRVKAQINPQKNYLMPIDSGVTKLQDECIKLIAMYINDVEMLGDISQVSMDKICQIISKNRSLDSNTMTLFLGPQSKEVKFYDCSKIDASNLIAIAQLSPNLEVLELSFCGRLTDEVLEYYAAHFKRLKNVKFAGAFLVRPAAWVKFFQNLGHNLFSLEISDSARFDVESVSALVSHCKNLEVLILSRITTMNDEIISLLSQLKNLKRLEISNPTQSTITDEGITKLLDEIGSGLVSISFEGCETLSETVLKHISIRCPRIKEISIARCSAEEITDEGVAKIFSEWPSSCEGLEKLDLERCVLLGDKAVVAILKQSHKTLHSLSLNSLDELSRDTFDELSKLKCKLMHYLDVSWVRCVDDSVLENVHKACPVLKQVQVFGDNHVSLRCEMPGVKIIGREDTT